MILMCNKGIECSEEFPIEYENQAVFIAMDSSNINNDNNSSSNNSISNMANLSSGGGGGVDEIETPRVKFLCSFGGSILPRPQDGKLRYVGGETRILSVPRDIGYEDLMGRMRELYEGAAILKYQQPDEDLDALVSVVNDDDVTNMMEEYDKLGSGDGFTRLRIFLFSHPDQDVSPHYMDGDERDTERRYVDALNSLSESPEYRRMQLNDSPIMTPVDEVHIADQFFNSMNLEGSVHNQRNYEMAMPQYNLRQLAIPSMGSGQHSGPVGQRYNEEAPWSPAYYSPRCAGAGPPDTRTFTEYPSSPSSARYRVPYQEFPDRMPEESNYPQPNGRIPIDHQHQYSDKPVWLPTGGMAVDRGGFPGNILSTPNVHDGTSVCEHCKTTFQRNPSSSDFHWKPEEQSHLEQSAIGNGFPQVASSCVGCFPHSEVSMLNTESKLHHGNYNKEQVDPRTLYSDTQTSERAWILQNQIRSDEPRTHVTGVGRVGDHYILDGTGTSTSVRPGNIPDGHFAPSTFAHHEDPRHIRAGVEVGGEVFRGQAMAAGPHVHVPLEERGVRTANLPYSYGTDVPHQGLQHGHPSARSMWRNVPPPVRVPPAYDPSNVQPRNGTASGVVPRSTIEGSPRFFVGADQSSWVESSHRRLGADGPGMPEYPYSPFSKLSPGAPFQEVQQTFAQDPLRNQPNMLNVPPPESLRSSEVPSMILNENSLSSGARVYSPVQKEDTNNFEVRLDDRSVHCEASESAHSKIAGQLNIDSLHPPEQNNNAKKMPTVESLTANNSNSINPGNGFKDGTQQAEANTCPSKEQADLTFLPELIASKKRAKLESAEVVKARAQEDGDAVVLHGTSTKVASPDETEAPDVDRNSDGGSENEYSDSSKIEPTKAEEEAIAQGLQTIRNDDLEEIRELGAGTYGSVYHGKWKGSDVAIKRIKASCFAGRPSERERLIADFWKEALILGSLHHPNVVSFYGIVRDGPDGSLATVTEFMVNGSLKQYLRKKDRTIDRRKRLMIAMDAAFGMEYLHGKNIVHFDLKCENLLVNMRDPHRPVCKIGDLGLSKVKRHTLVSGGVRGTLPWMAPELLSGKSNMVTEKIDVYSFGIVMWELLTGEEPYSDMHCASIIGGIVNNALRPQIPTWCDPEWKSLMESCWAPDPAGRPSFSEISQKLRGMAAAMNVK